MQKINGYVFSVLGYFLVTVLTLIWVWSQGAAQWLPSAPQGLNAVVISLHNFICNQ